MALDQATKTNVHTVLAAQERAGRLTRGTANAWLRTKGQKAIKERDPQAEIRRLRAKVNRLVAAQDNALVHLTAAKAHTTEPKKAQARITKAIKHLAV